MNDVTDNPEKSRGYYNLSIPRLVEKALVNGEGQLAAGGALRVETGKYTGRSPKDKFLVYSPQPADSLWWDGNKAISREKFNSLYSRVEAYLTGREHYVFDGYVGADPRYRLPLRVVNEFAWQNLFVHQLFLRPTAEELNELQPEFVLLCAPGFLADPEQDGTNSEAFILLDLEQKRGVIGGTSYAGEMKKSVFTVMNYLLPRQGVLSMHCSANMGAKGDTALFFGLSGTGKTTLSADPGRKLIGDDEHGWSHQGIFNIEGGCYAKCIGLKAEKEPQIWNALQFGSVLENVVLNAETRVPDYDDSRITENTRAAYPVDYIPGAVIPGVGRHPSAIIFLTADASGVLPPVARLSPEQAIYYFLSGYTSKLAGTERGVTEPQATFSTCFGAPFLPLHPVTYARMLRDKIQKYNARVYLLNTGWSGGPYGTGRRINLTYTRAMVKAILEQEFDSVTFRREPFFNLMIPEACPGVPGEVLSPLTTWPDQELYRERALKLAADFKDNFQRFSGVDSRVAASEPGND